MKNGVYGIAGVYPDRTKNDGKIDSEKEVYEKTEDTWAYDSTDVTHINN